MQKQPPTPRDTSIPPTMRVAVDIGYVRGCEKCELIVREMATLCIMDVSCTSFRYTPGRKHAHEVTEGPQALPGLSGGPTDAPGLSGGPTGAPGLSGGPTGAPGLSGGPTGVPGLSGGPTGAPGLYGGPTGAPGLYGGPTGAPGAAQAIESEDDLPISDVNGYHHDLVTIASEGLNGFDPP